MVLGRKKVYPRNNDIFGDFIARRKEGAERKRKMRDEETMFIQRVKEQERKRLIKKRIREDMRRRSKRKGIRKSFRSFMNSRIRF